MRYDFHIHTHHSYDSMMKPIKILQIAKERGLDGVVICDHNTVAGGLETKALNTDPNFEVIVGAEIRTNAGDVAGIHLSEEIKSREFGRVCDEIHAQGGQTILVHPYVDHDLSLVDFEKIDYVEVINARTSDKKNELAHALALKHNKPMVAGSDAHLYDEIGNAETDIAYESNSPVGTRKIKSARKYDQTLSQYIKAYKQGKPMIVIQSTIYLIKRIFSGR